MALNGLISHTANSIYLPFDIGVGPKGTAYIVAYDGKIRRLVGKDWVQCGPAVSREVEIPGLNKRGLLGAIAVGPDGHAWYFNNEKHVEVERFNPSNGSITKYAKGFPADLEPRNIGIGANGEVWIISNNSYGDFLAVFGI